MSATAALDPGSAGVDGSGGRSRTKKAPNAFRTISEVADDLHIPQHGLRFWETKFSQVRPLKRGGGRRYYRPDDIQLLRRIADLLYTQGYTIKGVQRLLREGGGKLGDDIPPAPRLEPAEAEPAEAQEPLLPFPEEFGRAEVGADLLAFGDAEPGGPDMPRVEDETELLRRILGELEELRSLLR